MKNKVGFAFFGRPTGHKCISNGLFKELNLDDNTYLNPDTVILSKGEQLIQVSRKIRNGLEIIEVFIFEYAESYNSRQGGFVGSAYVFTGHPTKKLLYNAVRIQHSKIFKLLNK